MQQTQQEHIQARLALLLGPETEEHMRVRAARRLGRQGPAILPVFLSTLNHYPEIIEPVWPWWPSQYTHCGRLLLYLCLQAHLSLEALLQSPRLTEPGGPVLWTCIMEAAGLQPYSDQERLLVQGLETSWPTVRYAAATALANRASKCILHSTTLASLYAHRGPHEDVPVRLAVACALLRSGEAAGIDALLQLSITYVPDAHSTCLFNTTNTGEIRKENLSAMRCNALPEGYSISEVRKAALFILSTEIPPYLASAQREQLQNHLIYLLQDSDHELAFQAALALSKVASPMLLPALGNLLTNQKTQTQICVLTVLEELAKQKSMRQLIRHLALPTRILPFLSAGSEELRCQASYTLATCGGEYVAAALGAIIFNRKHPGHHEAIESLRQLQGVQRAPLRNNVVRWLLSVLLYPCEDTQVAALDSLIHLLWQTRTHGQKQAWHAISLSIIQYNAIVPLLADPSPRVRQRAVELITILNAHPHMLEDLQPHMQCLLHTDRDSGVRASVAYACGQLGDRWSIPMLIQALLDVDEYVALAALHSLERMATPDDSIVSYVTSELARYRSFSRSSDTPRS